LFCLFQIQNKLDDALISFHCFSIGISICLLVLDDINVLLGLMS